MTTRRLKSAGASSKQTTAKKAVVKKGATLAPIATVDSKPAVKAKKKAVARSSHGISSNWAGESKGFNTSRSRTVVPNASFGSDKNLVLPPRSSDILDAVKAKYKGATFSRNDLDAAVLKRGIIKGFVQPVSGNGDSEADTYKFTAAGLAG